MDLNDLKLFIEVAKLGSFTKAAESLGMPKSTISRRLSIFETELGFPLLLRTTRKLQLTEAGLNLYERNASLIEQLAFNQQEVIDRHHQPKGLLRVMFPLEFFNQELGELVTEFAQHYPDIELCCRHYADTALPFDQLLEKVDLLFVLHEHALPQSDAIAKPLLSFPQKIYASPHCEPCQEISKLDFSNQAVIKQSGETHWLFRQPNGENLAISVHSRIQLNSPEMRLTAAIRGLGLVKMPTYFVQSAVDKGALYAVDTELPLLASQLSALYATRHLPYKARLFIDHLQNHIARLYTPLY
jgi:DNA-binding transcriptional LysR family regulator